MADSRILVFGGTFDPPHLAHTVLPPLVASQLGCSRILYVPAALNPLKAGQNTTSAEHRLAMLRLAISQVAGAEVSTIELERAGPSYTVDTLEALAERYGPETTLFLLMGSDQALAFHAWRDWQRILELATPAVMVRPPLDRAGFERKLREQYPAEEATRWLAWSIEVPQMDITATDVRQRLAGAERGPSADARGLLPPPVLAYIREHHLYGSG